MKWLLGNRQWLTGLGLCLLFSLAQASIPPRPQPPRLVNDFVKLLSPEHQALLEQKLVSYADTAGSQICIVIVKDFGGLDAGDFATQLGHQWGVGRSGNDDGVVVVLNTDKPRRVFIATGYGIEPYIPDAYAKRIVEQIIIPQFKLERYYDGLDQGTARIMELISGKFVVASSEAHKLPLSLIVFIVVLVLLLMFSSKRGSRGGPRQFGGRGPVITPMMFPMGGSGRGSFGGGGFGGFGGGGFGGGGAGGSW